MNNTRYEDFCNRMRVYRKRLGYNQADIGKELEYHRMTILKEKMD